ncbi:MAG: response regulator transcription factor [Candidatus Limnocylindrales bacterium]
MTGPPEMPAIRVLVVDDHTLIRQGIVGLLESQSDIEVVGQAGNGREAVATIQTIRPDVVLMDIAMPGISGLTATREIKERSPEVRILILTIHDREDYLFQALRAGASGYVLKGADVQDLLAAVRTAYRGEIYLFPSVTTTLVADYLRRARGGPDRAIYDGLSDREREILHLIAQGKTGPEIAAELFLSPHTVQSHRDHIMAKLDLHSKAALIKYAVARGLIEF